MARATTPPPPTLVLFVRHGQTPTTGKVLPGRAAGLHLAEKGQQQAETVAGAHRRAADGQAQDRGGVRVAARANAGDGRADRQGPRPAGAPQPGPARGRLRRVDRRRAEEALQEARVAHRAAQPERVPVPGRRVVHRDAGAHLRRGRPAPRRPPGPDRGRGVARRPDQGGRGPRHGHPPRPVPADRRVAVLGVGGALQRRRARRARRELHRRPRPPSRRHDVLRPARPGRVHRRHRRRARAARLLLPGPRRRHSSSPSAARSSRWPPWPSTSTGCSTTSSPPPTASRPATCGSPSPSRRAGPSAPSVSPTTSPTIGSSSCSRSSSRRTAEEGASVKVRLTRAQVSAFVQPRPRARGRPVGRRAGSAACPLDPDGHVCPRMN